MDATVLQINRIHVVSAHPTDILTEEPVRRLPGFGGNTEFGIPIQIIPFDIDDVDGKWIPLISPSRRMGLIRPSVPGLLNFRESNGLDNQMTKDCRFMSDAVP